MKRTLWFGAHKKSSEFNVTLVCSLQIVIILYKLIDTVEARSKEMQSNITNAVPAQHDALESNFIAKKKIRESSKYYNSQIKSVVAIYIMKHIIMIKTIVKFLLMYFQSLTPCQGREKGWNKE